MVDIETFRLIVLSFQGAEENPHFDRTAFKVIGRRIFATLNKKNKTANIIFSRTDQAMYCSFDKQSVYPVTNKWGEQGWTTFDLEKVPVELVSDALLTAYKDVFNSKPGKKRQSQTIKSRK